MKLKAILGLALLALALPGTAQADNAGLSVSGSGDVGTVTQNQTAQTGFITVSDTGTDPLDVTQSVTGPGWSVILDECTGVQLQPSSSCRIVLQVDTTNLGSFPGQLTVNATDDTDSTTAQQVVQLSATVVQPPPPVQVTSTSLSPRSFYPLVRDGYRDTATYHFTLNEPANGRVQIRNHAGHVVKSFKFSNQQSMTVKWNGRNKHNHKVKPGTYRFRVKARNVTNSVTSANRKIKVRTALVTRHATITRLGVHTSSRSSGAYSVGGNCAGTGPDGFGGLISTCLFAHATLTYTFTTRRHSTFRSLSHRVTSGIEPCRNSGWSVTHRRGSRTFHAIFTHGSVNDFSQCDIEYVSLHYNYKKRI